MNQLSPIGDIEFAAKLRVSADIGTPGVFRWVAIPDLVVDRTYQRLVMEAGRRNIRRIAEAFRWELFAPLVVAARPGGKFAILDGQHRANAAAVRGDLKELPCLVIEADDRMQARAFATINGIVTRVHPMHLFRARIAAGDAGAVAADRAARAAGARILAYPVEAKLLKPGETLARRTIEQAVARVGHDIVVAAIELITKTGDGNPGLLRADIIEGFSDCLFNHPDWAVKKVEVRAAVSAKGVRVLYEMTARAAGGRGARARMNAALAALLQRTVGDGGKSDTPVKTLGVVAREQLRRDNSPAPQPPPSQAVEDKVLNYLRDEGVRIIRLRAGVYSHHGKTSSIEELIGLANKMRETQRKPLFSMVSA